MNFDLSNLKESDLNLFNLIKFRKLVLSEIFDEVYITFIKRVRNKDYDIEIYRTPNNLLLGFLCSTDNKLFELQIQSEDMSGNEYIDHTITYQEGSEFVGSEMKSCVEDVVNVVLAIVKNEYFIESDDDFDYI